MPWHARLDLDYTLEAGRTVARFIHNGPLRILQSLYPEGDAICHNVLVHPPGGLVGGDTLEVRVTAAGRRPRPHHHAGRKRASTAPTARRPLQRARTCQLAAGARLEWLPLEALCYSGSLAENRLDHGASRRAPS
jgi:urease accessory protein